MTQRNHGIRAGLRRAERLVSCRARFWAASDGVEHRRRVVRPWSGVRGEQHLPDRRIDREVVGEGGGSPDEREQSASQLDVLAQRGVELIPRRSQPLVHREDRAQRKVGIRRTRQCPQNGNSSTPVSHPSRSRSAEALGETRPSRPGLGTMTLPTVSPQKVSTSEGQVFPELVRGDLSPELFPLATLVPKEEFEHVLTECFGHQSDFSICSRCGRQVGRQFLEAQRPAFGWARSHTLSSASAEILSLARCREDRQRAAPRR